MAPILTNREPFVNTFREREISQGVDNGGMDFHANLRAIRELRGISQTALALACGWDNPTRVTNYESRSDNPRNRRTPEPADILLLANRLNVPVGLLFSETPPKQLDQKSDLRSPSARLDAATLRNANLVLTTLLGASSKFDLDRDSDLISLAYTWTADRSDTALYEQLVAAAEQRKAQGDTNDSTRRDESNAGRARGASKPGK